MKMPLLCFLCFSCSMACVQAQGIRLDSGGALFLRNLSANSRPLLLSPLFNAHDRFSLSAFSRPDTLVAETRNPLFRKKAKVPDYVYKNLSYFVRGINSYTGAKTDHSFHLYIDNGGIGTRTGDFDYYSPGRSFWRAVSPFETRLYPHSTPYFPFPTAGVYRFYYWRRLFLYPLP